MHEVTFAGINLSVFDTFVTNAGVYSSPARSYDSISIPGRSGNLIMENNKFENVDHSYPLIIYEDFDENFPALKSFLLSQKGYQRLNDTFFPDEFYLATFSRFDSIKQKFMEGTMGTCILVFDRKPQRFLLSGEVESSFTASDTITNPTQFDALPLLRVYGSGILTIGGISISIDTSQAYLDIDCDLQEVLQNGGNLDVTLTNGEFPKLTSGENEIILGAGITKVDITPRWYTL